MYLFFLAKDNFRFVKLRNSRFILQWLKKTQSIYLLSQAFCLVFLTCQLYSETKDPHVNVILVDFSSTDIDVVAALKRSGLKRYVFFFSLIMYATFREIFHFLS